MKAFELIDARSSEEAVSLLEKYGARAQLFASGADLLHLRKDRIEGPAIRSPDILVNLSKIPGLDRIEATDRSLTVGAMVRLADLIEHGEVRSRYRLLALAAEKIASPQLRNTSTVAGNLCQRPRCWYFRNPDIVCLKKGGSSCWAVEGDNRFYHAIVEGGPCHIVHPSDLAPALVTMRARLRLLSSGGRRELPIGDFFVTTARSLHAENVLRQGELIEAIIVPLPPIDRRPAYEKATVRQGEEFALVSAAVMASLEKNICTGAAITFGGVSPRPYPAPAAEEALLGAAISDERVTAAARAAFRTAAPMSQNAYKLTLAEGLLRRAFRSLVA